jgi:hypothetical protein
MDQDGDWTGWASDGMSYFDDFLAGNESLFDNDFDNFFPVSPGTHMLQSLPGSHMPLSQDTRMQNELDLPHFLANTSVAVDRDWSVVDFGHNTSFGDGSKRPTSPNTKVHISCSNPLISYL